MSKTHQKRSRTTHYQSEATARLFPITSKHDNVATESISSLPAARNHLLSTDSQAVMIATIPDRPTAVSRNQDTDGATVLIDTATQTVDNSFSKISGHSTIDQVRRRRRNRQLNTATPLQNTDSTENCKVRNQIPGLLISKYRVSSILYRRYFLSIEGVIAATSENSYR